MKGQKLDMGTRLRIGELRHKHGLTFRQISERLGVVESSAHKFSHQLTLPEMFENLGGDAEAFLLHLQDIVPLNRLNRLYESFVSRSSS